VIEKTKLNGGGKEIAPSGDVYEGNLIDGVPHRKGKLTFAYGDEYEAIFPGYTRWLRNDHLA